jgi:hypothetical protein
MKKEKKHPATVDFRGGNVWTIYKRISRIGKKWAEWEGSIEHSGVKNNICKAMKVFVKQIK